MTTTDPLAEYMDYTNINPYQCETGACTKLGDTLEVLSTDGFGERDFCYGVYCPDHMTHELEALDRGEPWRIRDYTGRIINSNED